MDRQELLAAPVATVIRYMAFILHLCCWAEVEWVYIAFKAPYLEGNIRWSLLHSAQIVLSQQEGHRQPMGDAWF